MAEQGYPSVMAVCWRICKSIYDDFVHSQSQGANAECVQEFQIHKMDMGCIYRVDRGTRSTRQTSVEIGSSSIWMLRMQVMPTSLYRVVDVMLKIDFNLTGMGEMVELPGLMNAIRSVMNSQVAALCVLPNEIVVPLAPNVDVTKLFFPEPDGVIRLKIIEAKNLENRDISFIRKGKSDPYCEIQVGSQFLKTRTIDNDLNPVWNEYFEAVVDQAHGQKLRIELFDEDQGQDEELGRLSIDLKDIQAKGKRGNVVNVGVFGALSSSSSPHSANVSTTTLVSRHMLYVDAFGNRLTWFPLEGCKHGDLHLKASWMNLSKDRSHLEKQQWEAEWLQADKPIHPALLMVFVDSVTQRQNLNRHHFVEVTLGANAQRTPVKVKTVNPLYQSKVPVLCQASRGPGAQI
ncbi:C2 domain protein [Ostertagia ostertagi]